MKNIYHAFFISALTLLTGQSFAQEENGLPNNGLTHRLSTNEEFLLQSYTPSIMVTSPPTAPIRNIAEFEPTEAIIIAYKSGFGLPYSVIRDIASSGKVIIACASSSQSTALNLLNTNSVNTSNCSFLTTALDSWWTRDYTGWFIADNTNHVALVDFTYNRPRPNDDAVGALEATLLGIDFYEMGLEHTGGNYMTDGYGTSISTTLVVSENTSMTQTQIEQEVLDYLGISNYILRQDVQGEYIEHVDCWAKLLAPDKILIDSVPSSDSQYSLYEAVSAYFASTDCAYGYPYKVCRPLISGSSETNAEPYSNSLIFNNRVFVPMGGYSAAHDTAALLCYRKAMPGYIVKGYTSSGGAAWYGTDALHCRTHEIADREMLYIEHYPLHGLINDTPDYDIDAKILSYGDNAIATNYPIVKYRINHGTWDSVPMTSQGNDNFKGLIPTQNDGDTIYYYIKAKDVTGKIAYHPFIGQPDPHWFIADGTSVDVEEIVADPEMSFFTYPNPTSRDFILFTKSNFSGDAILSVYNITGSIVYSEKTYLEKGNSKKKINTENLTQGVYILELKTDSDVMTNKLIIK